MYKKIIGKISILILCFILAVICLIKITNAVTIGGRDIKDTYDLGNNALSDPIWFMTANIQNTWIPTNGKEINNKNRSLFIS